MNACADRDMAIPRLFDINTPFTIVTGGSELLFLGKEDLGQGREEEKDSLVQVIAPHLSRVMQHGTAKHVVAEGRGLSPREKNPCVSIIAQAESEDFQEFSPTTTRCLFPQQQLLDKLRSLGSKLILMSDTEDDDFVKATKLPHHHHHLQRKQRRKPRRRQSQESGEEPPIIRGLWVQEIDWLKSTGGDTAPSAEIIPPPPLFKDSPSCCCHGDLHADTLDEGCAHICECEDGLDSVETDDTSGSDRGDSDSDGLDLDSESVHTHDSNSSSDDETQPSEHGVESELTFDLMHMSGFDSRRDTWDCDSTGAEQNTLGLSDSTDIMTTSSCSCDFDGLSDADAVLDELRGRVTHTTKLLVSPFFKLLIKQTLNDWKHNVHVNEGLIFHHRLQPSASRYREGQEYHVLHHVQNGSYGDVFCVRDVSTGFECAAKRIPLSHFSSEEVSTWSTLNSPRVVELFGAVREGPNVVLFMDLKPACLAQLLKDMNSLPEDLALHYLHQTLGALDHLHHRKVLHLDVKVDNVLLSADCRDTFLCDFGLSETLDDSGWSIKAFRGGTFPGTETHMAPEVAAGERLCAKADVWSSCCMLLHMLNGCHPWTRYYSHPLCLQIVNEPPPLWEVPSNCNNFTAKMFRAGLRKDPDRRVSAKELRRKTTKALRAVGGLSPWSVQAACKILHRSNNQTEDPPRSLSPGTITATTPAAISAPTMYWVSPWRTTAVDEDSSDLQDGDSDVKTHLLTGEWDSQPKSLRDDFTAEGNDWETTSDSDVDIYMGEEELIQEYEGDWEEEEEEEEWDSSVSTEYHQALRGLFPLLQKGQQTNDGIWGSEAELQILRDDVPEGTVIQTASPEPRDDPPSCFSCSETSQVDASEKDSDHSSDDLSSGVFSSCNGHTDGHLDWLVSANQPSSCCFEGVDIWIENVQGECLRIRERRQVKVGHVAVGISDQISANAFTLETLDMKTVSFEDEIRDSCVWLRCVPAPDTCPRWTWRVRDGELQHH